MELKWWLRGVLIGGWLLMGMMTLTERATAADFMTEHPIPGTALNVTVEAPGQVWFTMPARSSIGSLVVSDTVQVNEYGTPTANSEPYDLVYATGVIWFSERAGNRIGRLDVSSGSITEFPIPTPNSQPTGIAIAPDGAIWFVGQAGNQFGRLDPATGLVTEFLYPTPDAQFEGIAVGPNQVVWATATNLNQLVSLDASATLPFFRYVYTTPYKRPMGIALDADGIPWLAPSDANFLIRYAPGTLALWRPYPITPQGEPTDITFRAKGTGWEFWFALNSANQAGQLIVQTSGAPVSLRQSPLPTAATQPWGIAVDADDHVWVATAQSNHIVEWVPPYFHLGHLPLVHQQ